MGEVIYGLLWEPPSEIVKFVQHYKDEIKKVESDAIYLSHPVHSTIFLFKTKSINESEIIKALEASVKSMQPINIFLNGWFIFNNDNATGGDTLIIDFKKDVKLLNFQVLLANCLKKYITGQIQYKNEWTGLYKISYDTYGFPFVGEHWVPHITVASVKKNGLELIKNIIKENYPNKNILLDNVTIFQIKDEQHIKIKNLKLEV